jgi:protocatechuate 3,4-dioxygenase beta subunit
MYRGGQATSDEAGRFTFQGIEEGTYELSVSGEDYANLQQTLRVVAPRPAPLKLVLRPLPVVTGRLLRPDGTPLAQAPVQVFLRIDGISVDRISEGRGGGGNWEITTDAQGRYRVPLRSPGRATLVFVVPDVGGERVAFTVPEGEDVVRPDVTLRPLASARGQVRRQGTGEPIAKANVAVYILAGSSIADVTDEEGRFTFRNLVGGTLRLRASAPDYLPCLQRIPAEPGQEVADVICELRPCPSLRGRLRGPDGQPLAGITAQVDIATLDRSEESKVTTDAEGKFSVTLKNPGRKKVWAASRLNAPNQVRTTTDREGRFSFADLPRGTYRVFAEADGRANLTLADVSVTGETPAAVALRLPVGGRIAGRVVGPDGQPVADAHVSTEASGRTWEPPENGLTLRRTSTDETGHFELSRLAPGAYRVTVWAEGLRKQTSAPVTVQEGETAPLEIRLK